MSMVTPIEPSTGGSPRASSALMESRRSIHATLFGRIESAVASSCGSIHAVNEDAHSPLEESGTLFVVADGVGGGAMAAMASRHLVSHLHAELDGHRIGDDCIREAVMSADRAIAKGIAEVTDLAGAATMALCAAANVFASKWAVAWVGDCRVYQLAADRDQPLRALTLDDTFGNLQETPPIGGALDNPARMVGNGAVSHANVVFTHVGHGDLLIICSDGVHKFVDDQDLTCLLRGQSSLAQRCEDVIALARANGSTDDATLLVVRRDGMTVQRPLWVDRLVNHERTRR